VEPRHGFLLERHERVSSTQDVLRRRHEAGEVITDVVVRAREQTAGRGRRAGTWSSSVGGSYQSVGLAPVRLGGGSSPALLPLALGVGVAEALSEAGARTMIKWPNDLVLGGRKLGGIIVEVSAGVPIAGLGVNVENVVPDGAAALRGWDVEVVSELVLAGVRRALETLVPDPVALVERFALVDWLKGKTVRLTGPDRAGVGCGIDVDGCLLLRGEMGDVTRHGSGHVVNIDGASWSSATLPSLDGGPKTSP